MGEQVLDLVTDEHTKIIQPPREKATFLHTPPSQPQAGIRESKRTLRKNEARFETIEGGLLPIGGVDFPCTPATCGTFHTLISRLR